MTPKDRSGRKKSKPVDASRQKPGAAPQPQTRAEARSARRSGNGADTRRSRSSARTGSPQRSGISGAISGVNPILLYTGVAVVVAVVVIAAALLLTRPPSVSTTSFTQPSVVTPASVAQSGQTLGSSSAPVTMDLYSDFRCTGCGYFYANQEAQLISNFVQTGKLKIVYHDFTLIDKLAAQRGVTTTASRDAANSGLCAADEGKFWTYHDWLFANQSQTEDPAAFSIDRMIAIAKAAGIDNSTFETCVRQGTHNSTVADEQTAAPKTIDATPTIYVNGKVVTSSKGVNQQPSYDEIAAAINAAASAASPAVGSPSPSAS
jgi:protein-disulfide isomerase